MEKRPKIKTSTPQADSPREQDANAANAVQRLELLSDAASRLLQTTHPVEVIDRIFDRLAAAFGFDFYFHFEMEPHAGRLKFRAARGISRQDAEAFASSEDVCGTVARDLKPIIIADAQPSNGPMASFIRGLGVTAYACHPLIANGMLLGTLSFGTHGQRAIGPEALETIRVLTDMFAAALARKRAEEALAERASLLDQSKDAIIVRGLDDRITFWNRGAETLYGWTEKEALGRFPHELLRSEFPGPIELIRERFRRDGFWEGEVVDAAKDGKRLTVLARWTIHRNADGEALGVIQTHTDITERKKVEHSVEQSTARLRLVVEGAPNGMVMVDRSGRMIMVNAQMERLFGYTRDEMIGQRIEMLLPERYRAAHPGQRQSFFQAPEARAMGHGRDLFARRKDGTEFPVEVGLNPAETPDGRVVLAAVIDITQRKKMEADLAQAHAELASHARTLEATVAERTAHLQATVAELEGVSYSLSHDMRAPLRTIQSFSQIVLEEAGEKLGPGEIDLLEKVISAASRLDRLIRDVLTFSRVSRAAIQLSRVDVEKLLRQILKERPEFQPPNADIDIQSPLHPVRGHEVYLTQCITNLLDNAAKFVQPNQKPRIRIWNELQDGRVRIWIEDNGIGIPKEAHERIFGIFQRVHGDQDGYAGTGIGLAIVRKAVERMGGAIGVESEPGKGSRFWIHLNRGDNA